MTGIWLLGLLACPSDARNLCADYLACAQSDASWSAVDAEERVGRGGSCWSEGTEVCFEECSFAYWDLPSRVRDACPIAWEAYGLLSPEAFTDQLTVLYCEEHVACVGTPCPFDGTTVVPDPTCRFDPMNAQYCLSNAWTCDSGEVQPAVACGVVCR